MYLEPLVLQITWRAKSKARIKQMSLK